MPPRRGKHLEENGLMHIKVTEYGFPYRYMATRLLRCHLTAEIRGTYSPMLSLQKVRDILELQFTSIKKKTDTLPKVKLPIT